MLGEDSQRTAAHDCVLFSTADWRERYWTNKQHVARGLAARGWRVLYVESVGFRLPMAGSGRDWRRLLRRLLDGLRCLLFGPAHVEPGLWVFSPLVIPAWKASPLSAAVDHLLLSGPVRRFLQASRFRKPVVWTYHPFIPPVPLAGPLVYHCVDDVAAVPGVDTTAYNEAEVVLIRQADVVFATSRPLHAKCAALNANSHFLSNVADIGHFNRAFTAEPLPADIDSIPGPRLCYHGVLSSFKIDFALLLRLAQIRPDWHLVLIGEEREGQVDALAVQMRRLSNVHFLGYRAYSDLPAYLRGMDVGLLPMRINAYTHSMFPMKLYEYLAAGVPVVSTPLPYTTESITRLRVGSSIEEFATAVEAQLGMGRLTKPEARAAVGRHNWNDRLSRMLEIVAAAEATSPRSVT